MKIEMDKKSEDYIKVKRANQCFLMCIVFEVVGSMTMLFLGSIGAQMAIYFMTFLFAYFLAKKTKLKVPIRKVALKEETDKTSNVVTLLLAIATTICGISVAMLLNAFAGMLSNGGTQTAEDINAYPVWLAFLSFAIIPAIVEEYVFRGVILEELLVLGTKEAILISSIFFSILHFSLGSVLYGFFFGLVFALVRLSTNNLFITMAMHITFNGINVALSYVGLQYVPGWIVVMAMLVGFVGFIVFLIWLLYKNPVIIDQGRYKKRCALTKEGMVSILICVFVMGMLFMM